MTTMYFSTLLMAMLVATASAQEDATTTTTDDLCYATCTSNATSGNEVCTFTTKVNLFAGELGYYEFEECGDVTNPTLAMELGKTYQFIQKDISNYYHPLGFAYYPDGAHDDVDELEPGIVPPSSSSWSSLCNEGMACPAPMYFLGDGYLGTYSNDASLVTPETTGEDNFGLDDYEPKFFHPLPEWMGYGTFSVYLKFDDDTFNQDIFYFCHIHQYMSGRIKLLKDGQPTQEDDVPPLGYEYDDSKRYDEKCGTYDLNSFQLPNEECPEKFVCNVPEDNEDLVQFSSCIDSMNCAMMVGMTSSVKESQSEIALFLHQMIPHHQNAVNMAKALLKTGKLDCDDITDEESDQADDCALEIILREIINNQNAQIQAMQAILESKGWPEKDECKVTLSFEDEPVDEEESADEEPAAEEEPVEQTEEEESIPSSEDDSTNQIRNTQTDKSSAGTVSSLNGSFAMLMSGVFVLLVKVL